MTKPASAFPVRRTLTFIFVTVVLDILAFGISVPVLPRLIEQFTGDTASAARWFGVFGTVWALMQFVFSPLLGVLSDRFGRRPVILLSLLGLGVDYIVMAVAPSMAWLFLGRTVSGICGASYTTAGAYIADVTTPETRAAGFGLIGAAWGLGFVLGPAIGGILGATDPRLPFKVAAAVVLLNAAYGYFFLPESLPPEKRSHVRWSRANPIGALKLLRSHRELLGLAGVNLLYYLSHQVLPSAFVIYVGHRYGWGIRKVGLSLAVIGIASAVVQGGLIRPLVRRIGERRAMFAGLLSAALGSLIYGLAPTGAWFWVGVPFGALSGLFSPAVQGIMTKRVRADEQGQLQGANSSVQGICGMIGPGLFTMVLAWSIASGTAIQGAPFFLAGGITLAALVLALWETRRAASAEAGAAAPA